MDPDPISGSNSPHIAANSRDDAGALMTQRHWHGTQHANAQQREGTGSQPGGLDFD